MKQLLTAFKKGMLKSSEDFVVTRGQDGRQQVHLHPRILPPSPALGPEIILSEGGFSPLEEETVYEIYGTGTDYGGAPHFRMTRITMFVGTSDEEITAHVGWGPDGAGATYITFDGYPGPFVTLNVSETDFVKSIEIPLNGFILINTGNWVSGPPPSTGSLSYRLYGILL